MRKPKTYPPLASVLKITKVGPNFDVLIVIYKIYSRTVAYRRSLTSRNFFLFCIFQVILYIKYKLLKICSKKINCHDL